MDETLQACITAKMAEVGAAMATFASTAVKVSETLPVNPFVGMMLLLKSGEQARDLADRLFEFSELMEELKNLGQ